MIFFTIGNVFDHLLDKPNTVFIHNCNCFNTMGKGIALTVKKKYPKLYIVDQATKRGDPDKLGSYTSAPMEVVGQSVIGVNFYGMYRWGYQDMVKYEVWRDGLGTIVRDFKGCNFVLPFIGANNAGGDVHRLRALLDDVFFYETAIVYCRSDNLP